MYLVYFLCVALAFLLGIAAILTLLREPAEVRKLRAQEVARREREKAQEQKEQAKKMAKDYDLPWPGGG